MDEKAYWTAVNSVLGMHPGLFFRLKDHFGSIKAVWDATEEALEESGRIRPAELKNLVDARAGRADGELKAAEENGIKVITLEEDGYPAPLRELSDPPPVLYIRGEWREGDERAVAIVGSRRCTQYGRDIAEEIAGGLARAGVTVVSGLAYGIDARAHRGALGAGGRTAAVLPSGMLNIQPQSNAGLAEEIAGSGCLISEFSLGKRPEKWDYVRRNRLISGLSMGTVVIEAPEGSGALITAKHAAEQGRAVFGVPGNVRSDANRGTHALIRDGAVLVESAEQVLEALELGPKQGELPLEVDLDERHGRVFDLIRYEPQVFDNICIETSFGAGEISVILLSLEMKGLIKQLPGKMYVRRR
ncbi:MAG: DNA-processing protein DprA [bacterium]